MISLRRSRAGRASGAFLPKRIANALFLAEELGWLEFVGPSEGGYVVVVDGIRRELPGHMVLPYVLGVGDARGEGHKVAYRDGLG